MKKIGIGYEFYKRMIDDGCYYVDKTMLIKDVVEKGGTVTLFTRPRRFGKTLALSTLKTFFEKEYDYNGNIVDNRRYFEGMKIMEAGEDILSRLGKYPVLSLTLKSTKQPTFKGAFYKLKTSIVDEIARHSYLLNSEKLNPVEKSKIQNWLSTDSKAYIEDAEGDKKLYEDLNTFSTSFGEFSRMLKKHYGENVIILMDEYDVPLENAYFAGFYDEMIGFIRSFFENALKTNDSLEFAVITGCLRISKESIFTGLNNLSINSVRSEKFAEYFGFTQEETDLMLKEYNLADKVEEVKNWYDGYLFGNTAVYNPWSVTKYVDDHEVKHDKLPEPYWSNTSSNSIIRNLIYTADSNMKEELDRLVNGGTIEKKIHEDITYGDISFKDNEKNDENLWNFLFFTGYLKKVSERSIKEDIYLTMCIPNAEIRSIYRNQITDWFDMEVKKKADYSILHKAVMSKDTEAISEFVNSILEQCISYFDSDESFYHGIFLSMLYGTPGYSVRSNREEGNGRADIVMYPNRPKDPAILFELKVRKKFNEMDDGIEEAFTQIRDKKYEEGILEEGYAGVVSFGVCFCKKSCIVSVYRS
ncbi:MAG: AAA family ATPase [Lachnospiraceae bacterium]|nr:AAA family ATPase [Lachnospiraceae bacterium]